MNPYVDRGRGALFALLTTTVLLILTGCTPQVLLVVTIASPNTAVITNGTVTVQVAVEGGTPSGVSLLLDGSLLVELSAPYTYAWDTVGTAEADYQLTARATLGGSSFDSDPLAVTVDRTPPTVLTRSPTPGSGAVWLGEEIRATFSEPLAVATLTDTTVELLDGASPLAKTLTLDVDVGALTLTLDQAPSLPATLTAALSPSITDLAGNALALPGGAWSWGVEAFALYGGALNGIDAGQGIGFASIAFGPDGLPMVAWGESDGSAWQLFVRRWDGTAWRPIGGPQGNGNPILLTDLGFDSAGAPIVVWDELTSTAGTVIISRWDGNAWQPLGGGFEGFLPSLAIDDSDRPIVAVNTPNGANFDVMVRRWDGSAWQPLGTSLSANAGDTNASKSSIAFDGTQPLVTWSESDGAETFVYVRRWDGNAWQPLGVAIDAVALQDAGLPSMATEQDGTPVVAFRESIGSETKIFAFRWTGAAWSQIGTAFDSGAGRLASNADLAIDPSDRPVVTWAEFTTGVPNDIFAARFDGSWTLLPTVTSAVSGDTDAAVPSLAIDGDGEPWIAWVEQGDPTSVYVQGPNALP
jgi:hypothetical protein